MPDLLPQQQIYTLFDPKNSLYSLAQKNPENMCWLATLLYALQFMGFKNDKKLHLKLSRLLYVSYDLMAVNEENGALMFVKKYELRDKTIQIQLNKLFKEISLKIKVEKILSNITFEEINKIKNYLNSGKKLLTIIKNIDILHPNDEIKMDIPNHVVLLLDVEDLGDGSLRVVFADPAVGDYLEGNIPLHSFIQWIQYIWVLEKRRGMFGF